MEKKKTVSYWIFLLVRVFSIILIVVTIINGHWLGTFNAGLTLFVTFLPNILQKKWNIVYPIELWIVALLFVMAALIFGEVFDFYYRFVWWDAALHTLSGFVIAMIAFIVVKQLNENIDIRVTLSPLFIALFAVCFSMSIGVVWEIFEYTMDSAFGTNMQKSGLVDTMQDLIVCTIGSVTVGIMGYTHLKTGKNNMIGRMMDKQEKISLEK
ncbi:MAG: hypothetical protein ACKUBY_01190 [Candidatus Moraniibacteriota bacterium]|jgi:hypothetical protein